MKSMRIIQVFSVMVILALLVLALPAREAYAAPEIEIDPEEGSIGTTITVVGTGFNQSTDDTEKYAVVYFSSEEASTVDDIDSDVVVYEVVKDPVYLDFDGEFEITFTVPDELNDGPDEDDDEVVTSGTYYIYVCHYLSVSPTPVISKRIRAIAEFTVIGGELALDPDEGPVGTEVEITGTAFLSREDIEIEFDGSALDIIDGDDETDREGDFVSFVEIPEATAGDHTITVIVSATEVEATFTVEPDAIVEPTSGEAGSDVSVSGTGFGRRTDVVVYFNNVGVATATTSSSGSFSTTFIVPPDLAPDIYDVEIEDDDDNLDSVKFTVIIPATPTPTPSPTPTAPPTAVNLSATSGQAGDSIIITGAGFQAASIVTIAFGGQIIASLPTDASGLFVGTVQVPEGSPGEHTITITDGLSTQEIDFTLEAEPPSIPSPLLPEMGVRVNIPVTFDWEAVTAAVEPVTYRLQVATSEDFAGDSIILEKEGLDDSEYITTEVEGRRLAEYDDVLYWRVRAVDAAGGEGEWTGAGEFYVSKPFSFPTWALYTLLALGGLVLFAVGYWMGRRTAYYYVI